MKLTQCPRLGVPYLVGDGLNMGKRVIVKARCKQWDCEYCAPINKYEHYNRIANGISKLWSDELPMQFVTVTCHEKWRGKDASIKNWRRNKDKLLARIRRRYAQDTESKIEYVYIPELHEDETIHIHGIFQGDFESRWWKDNSRECGLGYMAESSKLASVLQAINYITKYMVKEIGKPQFIQGFRRICYSQGFPPKSHNTSDLDWRLLDRTESIESAIIQGVLNGLVVKFDGNTFTTTDDLSGSG